MALVAAYEGRQVDVAEKDGTEVPGSKETATSEDPAVDLFLRTYGDPRGVGVSYERGTPVLAAHVRNLLDLEVASGTHDMSTANQKPLDQISTLLNFEFSNEDEVHAVHVSGSHGVEPVGVGWERFCVAMRRDNPPFFITHRRAPPSREYMGTSPIRKRPSP